MTTSKRNGKFEPSDVGCESAPEQTPQVTTTKLLTCPTCNCQSVTRGSRPSEELPHLMKFIYTCEVCGTRKTYLASPPGMLAR